MTAPPAEYEATPRSERSHSSGRSSAGFARALASPYAILIAFPSIVFAVGLFLALQGQRALKVSNVALGERRLSEQAQLVASRLGGALEAADPMLDRLSDFALTHGPERPLEDAAAVLADLMQGRAGVAYASISFPDGTFQGTYVDVDGRLRFQDSRVGAQGTRVRRYDYRGHGLITLKSESSSAYDPRRRGFYVLATDARRRVWTEPYVFYGTHYTGVTRAAPIYLQDASERRLHAVLTIDFDVSELSRLARSGELSGMRTLLFTSKGTLLGYTKHATGPVPTPEDHVLSYRDLHDSTLDAFFNALAQRPRNARQLLAFDDAGVQQLAALARVGRDETLDFNVAYVVPESVFFESLHVYGRRSFTIAALAVLLALGVSVALARLIVKERREAAEARAEAKRASREARELGSYRLLKCLGKGGMGEVWRAEHRLLARQAAIKLIRSPSGAPASRDAQERFRREAQSLAGLRSRNTIELFDYGVSDDGTFFYVMELLDGLDLENLVLKHGRQPPGRVLRLLMQACRSLAEAHDAGFVHRDIKPANLFVCRVADELDVVKVLDFGLVRGLAPNAQAEPMSIAEVLATTNDLGITLPENARLTRVGMVMGTPEFMAPEQALGLPLDGRADLYALGCVGYWLLTGELLFKKQTSMQVLLAHINEAPTPLEQQARLPLPGGLRACIMACLAKAPEQRPQTARELLTRLSEAERELSPNETWTDADALAWWQLHLPLPRTTPPAATTPSPPGQLRIADAPTADQR
jgi:serine/threonine protein kinase